MKSLKIPASLHHRCKLAALQKGVKLFEFVEQALLDKLEPETFETSECAQGIGHTGSLLEPEEDLIEDDEPTDAEKLATGKFFILNGVVTPKRK